MGSRRRRDRNRRAQGISQPMAQSDRRRVYLADVPILDRSLPFHVCSPPEVSSVIEWLLKKLVTRLPFRTITSPDGRPYLTRWYVWPKGPRTAEDAVTPTAPFAVFIHFFHRSDEDRELHNHPWDKSVALILKGGYHEEREDGFRTFRPGDINVISKDDYHRVELLYPKKGSWSLFIAGKNVGSWGFKDERTGRHIPWKEYLGGKNTVV
jgi:hypothetical protein